MIAAIDLGGTRTKFGLVEDGRVVVASMCPADAQSSLKAHLDMVLIQLRKLCSERGETLERCDGIGLLSTGIVDNRRMRVCSTNGKYDDAVEFDFPRWAQSNTGLSLRIDNDARGALAGEWRFGAGQGANHLLMVTIGTGIGVAAVVDGRLLSGAHFSGGILGGHIIVRSNGRRCTCGGRGCLEAEASGWALPIIAQEHPDYENSCLRRLDTIGFKELMTYAAEDRCAGEVYQHCLQLWGEALVSWIHMFDPERIIVGGGIMHQSEPILRSFRQTIAERIWGDAGKIEIVSAQHPDHAGLIGAGALFFSEKS